MTLSFVLMSYAIICVANSMEWVPVWNDDCDSPSSWRCHELSAGGAWLPSDSCEFGQEETELHNCKDTGGKCHRIPANHSIDNDDAITISDYTGHPLRLSVYVASSNHHTNNARCEIYVAYDDWDWELYWDCGPKALYGPPNCEWNNNGVNGVVTVDIVSGYNTMWIALETYGDSDEYCHFDTITLWYLPPPTSAPTASTHHPTHTPTSSPTKQPTLAPVTKQPTQSPTKQPTAVPTPSPTVPPTLYPPVTPTKQPSTPPTLPPTAPPSTTPTLPPTLPPYTSISSTMVANDMRTTVNIENTDHMARQQNTGWVVFGVIGAVLGIAVLCILTVFVARLLFFEFRGKDETVIMKNSHKVSDTDNRRYTTEPGASHGLPTETIDENIQNCNEDSKTCNKTSEYRVGKCVAKCEACGHEAAGKRDEDGYFYCGRCWDKYDNEDEELYKTGEESKVTVGNSYEGHTIGHTHGGDNQTTTGGSVMHISDETVQTSGNYQNEEQKEDVLLNKMLDDIVEMQSLDPNLGALRA